MGYLNNTTRTLDAILTKKGRELLSTGGNFEVTQFALGDDEIDYSLWDASHTQGTDYYGAVIENLPALEPFNDPSEIMKYKLVTRDEGTTAMAKLIEPDGETIQGVHAVPGATTKAGAETNTGLHGLMFVDVDSPNNWHQVNGIDAGGDTGWKLGSAARVGISHLANNNTQDVPNFGDYSVETFTVTLLDASICVLAPVPGLQGEGEGLDYGIIESPTAATENLWLPFVKSPQRLSQTITGVTREADGTLHAIGNGGMRLYAKRISSNSSPAKTSIIITGEESGAVYEYDVTVSYYTS